MGNSAFMSLISIGCFTCVFHTHLPIPKAICIRDTEVLLRKEELKQCFFKNHGPLFSLRRGQGGFYTSFCSNVYMVNCFMQRVIKISLNFLLLFFQSTLQFLIPSLSHYHYPVLIIFLTA